MSATARLNGLAVVTGDAIALARDARGTVTQTEQPFVAIPYYAFKPVTTDTLRLELTMQPNWSVGLQEWKVR